MRTDPIQFALANTARSRKPRWVIKIEFPFGSIYCTSHSDITGVPGTVLSGVIQKPSALSQRLFPDEGRSEIGTFTFTVVDKAQGLTAALRDQLLNNGAGIRGRRVSFYIGYAGFDFTAFSLFGTYTVDGCTYKNGLYTVRGADITRSLRAEVFKPYTTTLTATIAAADTTIPANDTSKFLTVAHGTSYSDAPSSTVGYIRIEDEIIRYTGKTGTSFTGCTRGVFNTLAVAHTVDATTPVSRRTKLEEFIYLELPGPKLAYAVLTGIIHGTANTLPSHWHLGTDPALVRVTDFETIGPDLWVTTDDASAAPLIFRFEGLKAQDGKRFIEKELCLLLGCYSPVYTDGTLGLRRMSPVISTTPPVITLTEREIVSTSELEHAFELMHNKFSVQWGYDQVRNDFIRETAFVDEESILAHGSSPLLTYKFLGLHSQRATDATILKKLDSIRDRYAEPPQTLQISVLGSLNRLELGDIAGINVPPSVLRDFAGAAGNYSRSHEIQQKAYDAFSGDVRLDLFGSTARPSALPLGSGATPPLADAFYTSAGTNLTSIITITNGVAATGSFTLTGNASLNASGAIFYFAGDLTIPNGCNITIANNVQLRVRGFLTLNGTINGVGNGHAGTPDTGAGTWDSTFPGTPGFVGNSRGWDGAQNYGTIRVAGARTIPALLTRALYDSFPTLELGISASAVLGLPNDLRGTGGAPGGRIIGVAGDAVLAEGGDGADGGAGFCIICRGMSIGGSGNITLDGESSASTSSVAFAPFGAQVYPGSGGAGGPGAFLLLLDGDTLSVPEITLINFSAKTGTVPQLGNPMPKADNPTGLAGSSINFLQPPIAGYAAPDVVSALNFSTAARGLQFIPSPVDTAIADPDYLPAAPTNLTASPGPGSNTLRVTGSLSDPRDSFEIYASLNNDRTNAVLVAKGRVTEFTHDLPVLATRYYWALVRRELQVRPDVLSPFYPTSPTGGVVATSLNPGSWTPVTTAASGATMIVTANQIQKSGGTLAWDSQVYSLESYSGGCALSFRAMQANAHFMIGLNTDPTTDADYSSIDYAFYCQNDGTLDIYENGSVVVNDVSGGYDTSTAISITYDGAYVRFLRNGVEVRKVPRIAERFYFDSSWYTPGAAAAAVQFIPLAPAQNAIALVARGNCVTLGNGIRKAGGSGAYDSDCYSLAAFAGGCVVSFRPATTVERFLLGLNSDPTTDQNYTSIDYCWFCSDAGSVVEMYESGVNVGTVGTYTASTVFEIRYDGNWIRYYKDGVLAREKFDPDRTFFLDSSFYNPGSSALDVTFAPITRATPSPFIARGNCKVSDTNVIKQGGSSVWDSDCFSISGYPVCHVAFKANQANANLMVGLNTDPTADQDYTSIDYAWYCIDNGLLTVYESGSSVGSGYGGYTAATLLAITYDGSTVTYWKDGVSMRTVSVSSLTLFMDSSFDTPGCGINSVRFGPTTNLAVNDTWQLGLNAATEVAQVTDAGPLTPGLSGSPGTHQRFQVKYVTLTIPSADYAVEVTATFTVTAFDSALSLTNGSGTNVKFSAMVGDTGGSTVTDISSPLNADGFSAPTAVMKTVSGVVTGLTPGNYRFGIGLDLTIAASKDGVFTSFVSVTVRAAVIKR